MKGFIKSAFNCFTIGATIGAGYAIGAYGGIWMWENVLEDKLDDLKCFVRNKFSKEEEA